MDLFVLIVLAFSFTQSHSTDNEKVLKDSIEFKSRNAKLSKGKYAKVSKYREYFCIMSKSHSEVALVASVTKVGEVLIKVTNGVVRSQELWFWDGVDQNIIRNKRYPQKVIN